MKPLKIFFRGTGAKASYERLFHSFEGAVKIEIARGLDKIAEANHLTHMSVKRVLSLRKEV